MGKASNRKRDRRLARAEDARHLRLRGRTSSFTGTVGTTVRQWLGLRATRGRPRPRVRPDDRAGNGGRSRLGRGSILVHGRALEQGIGLAGERVQRELWRLRHPTFASGRQDGRSGAGLADQSRHTDLVGTYVHFVALRVALRCLGTFGGCRLVLIGPSGEHGRRDPVGRPVALIPPGLSSPSSTWSLAVAFAWSQIVTRALRGRRASHLSQSDTLAHREGGHVDREGACREAEHGCAREKSGRRQSQAGDGISDHH